MSFLVNSAWGPQHLENATVPFVIANAAAGKGQARVFLTCDALNLVVKGRADALVAEGYTPVKTLIDEYVAKGGRIWVCKVCAAVMGVSQDDLVDGAEIGGAGDTMAFLEAGGRTLM